LSDIFEGFIYISFVTIYTCLHSLLHKIRLSIIFNPQMKTLINSLKWTYRHLHIVTLQMDHQRCIKLAMIVTTQL